MACAEWQAKLDLYLDGELSAEDLRAFDSHLRGCSSCAADVLARLQLKRSVQLAGRKFAPSSEFRQRMQRVIAPSTSRRGWVWQLASVTAVVLLLAASLLTHFSGSRSRQEQLYGELADLHITTLASTTQVDVVSSDHHTVKPWFQGKIPFTFNLPDLASSDFSLLGGRIAYLGRVPGAHLIYQIRKHEISVFIFPDEFIDNHLPDQSPVARRTSFNVITWREDGLRYFALGDVNSEDLQSLTTLFKEAAAH